MSTHKTNSKILQPFIQWVGGKRKIAPQLIKHLPETGLNNYYEPFLGGGALFFQVKHMFKQCYLSDINLDLVTSYNAVKYYPEQVGQLLQSHVQNHSKEYYYQVRNINNSNNPQIISARFLYLNRYAFKGIYRINKNGTLDLSYSYKRHKNLNIEEKLKNCSDCLSDVSIYAGDFSFIDPKPDDFVYFDPPYHEAGERFYTRLPFDENEQIRLRDFAKTLDHKGVRFMISNSNTDFIRNLYKGFNINIIEVQYSLPRQRKQIKELVITNY